MFKHTVLTLSTALAVVTGPAAATEPSTPNTEAATAPEIQSISCGAAQHCVLALPQGVQVLDLFDVSSDLQSEHFTVNDRAYVVVAHLGGDSSARKISLTAFTNVGPYIFVVDRDEDQIDHYVELN